MSGTGGVPRRLPGLPRWAVIKEARRRQRRRRLRVLVALGAAVLASTGWALRSGPAAGPGSASPVRPSAVVTRDVALGGSPIGAVARRDALWVLTCVRGCSGAQLSSGQLLEVASRSGRVIKRFSVADPQALAVGDGGIWIAHFLTGIVTRIGPATGRATATIHLVLPRPVVFGDRRFLPSGISVGAGRVWVSTARGWIAQIDARASRLVAMLPSPSEETHVAVASQRTWVAEDLAGVGVVQANTHRLAIHQGSYAGQTVDVVDVKSGGGLIWAFGEFLDPHLPDAQYSSVVTAIDPRTGHIRHQLPIAGASETITYGNGALYVADFPRARLYRITPDYKIQTLRSVRGRDRLVGATPGALWATTTSNRLVRITVPKP